MILNNPIHKKYLELWLKKNIDYFNFFYDFGRWINKVN